MPVIPCKLDHTIHIVIKPETLHREHGLSPHVVPRHHEQIEARLNHISRFGIATLLNIEDNQILFCTPTYTIMTRLTKGRKDGYYVHWIRPINIRQHTKLCEKAISIRAPKWQIHANVHSLNSTALGGEMAPQSGYEQIENAWKSYSEIRIAPEALEELKTPEQIAFLESISQIIDVTEKCEGENVSQGRMIPYISVESVASARSFGDVYAFSLAAPSPFQENEYVRIVPAEIGLNGPGQEGIVAQINNNIVTIKFQRQLNLDQIPRFGIVQHWISTRVYDIQRASVASLRDQTARNSRLLQVVADKVFTDFQSSDQLGNAAFNLAQQRFLSRAATVPDLLLVLGPPGTGKTHTIRAVVEAESRQNHRVLITSQNNKAVDNVLEGLTEVKDLSVLRIGRVEKISPAIQPFLIDEKARKLQSTILEETDRAYKHLSTLTQRWGEVERYLIHLHKTAEAWKQAIVQEQEALKKLYDWQHQQGNRLVPILTRKAQALKRQRSKALRFVRSAHLWSRAATIFDQMQSWPVVASLGTVLTAWTYRGWSRVEKGFQTAAAQFERDRTTFQHDYAQYLYHVTAGSEIIALKSIYAQAVSHVDEIEHQVRSLLTRATVFFSRGLAHPPPIPEVVNVATVQAFVQHALALQEPAKRRYNLLHDWRTHLEQRHQALYSSLIREADVVGATCIGIATDIRFEDLDFNLVIADEAGQIHATDLLVPLARAERAILVGDHKQLPPVTADEILKGLREDDTLRALMTISLFELLFEHADEAHRVVLDTQYRMPRVIADFVKTHFYDGKYETAGKTTYRDPLFEEPFVFIDMKNRPGRYEKPHQRGGEQQGYINPLEAELISDLVVAYVGFGANIGVIVPYNAQAEHIREIVRLQLPSFPPAQLPELIATVDSFQGKERDVILFGFTRSNTAGSIGFLRELRRLNVSITRAKRQLVLVGDSQTLSFAQDTDFARLSRALIAYIQKHGEYLTYEQYLHKQQ